MLFSIGVNWIVSVIASVILACTSLLKQCHIRRVDNYIETREHKSGGIKAYIIRVINVTEIGVSLKPWYTLRFCSKRDSVDNEIVGYLSQFLEVPFVICLKPHILWLQLVDRRRERRFYGDICEERRSSRDDEQSSSSSSAFANNDEDQRVVDVATA